MEKVEINEELKKKVFKHLGKYASPSTALALFNIALTFVYLIITFILERSEKRPLQVFAFLFRTGLYVRFFVIMHDNGHEAYFQDQKKDDLCGMIMGIVTGANYKRWKRSHNNHHKISNDLQFVQEGQTAPMTLEKLKSLQPKWQKFYIFFFSTLGFALLGPFSLRLFNFIGAYLIHKPTFISIILVTCIKAYFGSFWFDQVVLHLSSLLGCFMFHVQHTFPELKREYNKDFFVNGFTGSTYLELPSFLKFFTHGIEYHHVHHLNIKIPAYRLQTCFDDAEKQDLNFWRGVKRVNLWDMYRIEFTVYDEKKDRLIGKYETWQELKHYTVEKLE